MISGKYTYNSMKPKSACVIAWQYMLFVMFEIYRLKYEKSDIAKYKYSNLITNHKEYTMIGISFLITAAMAQWVRAFVPQAEGWVFESQSRQI